MKLLCLGLLFLLRVPAVIAGDSVPAWSSDFIAAADIAAKTGRPLLLNFTGSDWCVWCHRLRDEVFQTPFFIRYADEALVLVEVDFPRKKSLPPELKQQNDSLAQRFNVDSYPTVLLLSPDGKELARLGYMQGGPKTFVRELKRRIASADQPTKD